VTGTTITRSTLLPLSPGHTDWLRVVTGTALVRIGERRSDRPADHPAIAVLQPGDVVIPTFRHRMHVEPVGSAEFEHVTAAEVLADPALRQALDRWFDAICEAANVPRPNFRELTEQETTGRADLLRSRTEDVVAAALTLQDDRARGRERRYVDRPVSVDAAAVDTVADAVPLLRSRTATVAADPDAAVLALLGYPVPARTDHGPDPDPPPAAGEPSGPDEPGAAGGSGDPGPVVARLGDRARGAGHLVRLVQLGDGVRHDLRTSVAAQWQGRAVALLPRLLGTLLIDPATGVRRRLRRGDLAELSPVAVGIVPELPYRATWKALGRLAVRDSHWDLGMLATITLIGGIAPLLLPIAAGAIFGSIVPGRQTERLVGLVLAVVVVIAATATLSVLQGRLTTRVRTRIDSTTGDAIWSRLIRLPLSFFGRYSSGDLLTRASVIDTLRTTVADSVVSTAVAGSTTVVSLLLIFFQNSLAGLFTLVIVLVQAIACWVLVRRWGPLLARQVAEQRRLASATLQTMQAVSRIRAVAAEERAIEQLSTRYSAVARTGFRVSQWTSVVSTGLAAWPTLGTLAITAGVVMAGDRTHVAGYVVLTTALSQVLTATGTLISTVVQLVGVGPQLAELKPILDTEPEVETPGGDAGSRRLQGGVELAGVTFRYTPDGPDVLHDVSVSARPGEFVAVVGPSGSGKSTLVRMLLGFEKPQHGSVRFDGIDLARLDLREVRSQIGTVLQSEQLIPGSVADNIRGTRLLTQQQIWTAAEQAAVADDLRAMPMGLQTVVVEGAATLSGGQRQRVVLARALAGRPAVLLLDEATSALDNRAQARVARSLDELELTRIVIAHRLSTVRNADRIVVLDNGRIVQQGSYDQLIDRPGMFADLAHRQLLEG
jgi:ABC-type bacteriocin/lantibiotic exporter with double-glycine peptidase domain